MRDISKQQQGCAPRHPTTQTSSQQAGIAATAEPVGGSTANMFAIGADKVDLALATLFGGGHLLVEDLPGTGKTLLAKSIAAAIGGRFGRVQCTPDLLPTDITGTSVARTSA